MDLTMVLTFAFAVGVGAMIGILPGLAKSHAILMCYFFLQGLDATNLLIFFVVVGSISQFMGSVVATTTGIPGETSSIPAAREGPMLVAKGQGVEALSMAAIGSFFGTAVFGFLLLFFLQDIAGMVTSFYNNSVQTVIFVLVAILLLITTNNRFFINLLLLLFGAALSMVGTHHATSTMLKFNFGIETLFGGIPLVVMGIGLVAIPQILRHFTNIDYNKIQGIQQLSLWRGLTLYPKYFWAGIRGTIVGSFAGLIPGSGMTMSSTIAYFLEKKLRISRKTYKTDGDMHSLVGAETANNVAILVALIPLFLFSMPVGPAEAMILNLIEQSGVFIGVGVLSADQYFLPAVIAFLISGVFGVVLAWQGAKHVLKIFKLPSNLLKSVLLLLLVLSVVYAGYLSHSIPTYLLLLGVFTAIGLALRKYQTEIVIFSFLIYPMLEGSLVRFYFINF